MYLQFLYECRNSCQKFLQIHKNISFTQNSIIIDDKKISILNEPNLNQLCWDKFNVDIVFECTGHFKTFEETFPQKNNPPKRCNP